MKKVLKIKCPRCQKPSLYSEDNPNRPFCSAVCKLEDIGAWAYDEYKIAGPPADPDEFPSYDKDEEP